MTEQPSGDQLNDLADIASLHVVEARLGGTGVGPFDESYFISFATLDGLIDAWRGNLSCRRHPHLGEAGRGRPHAFDAATAIAQHRHNLLSRPCIVSA